MRDPFRPLRGVKRQGNCGDLADIRRVYKVGVINLIWRHLVRPLYADGTVGREAAALRAGLSLPQVPAWPTAVFRSAGLEDEDIAGIRTVLAAYDRTNAMCLIAFLAVQLRLEGVPRPVEVVARRPATVPAEPEPDLPLPPLLPLADMSPMTAELGSL